MKCRLGEVQEHNSCLQGQRPSGYSWEGTVTPGTAQLLRHNPGWEGEAVRTFWYQLLSPWLASYHSPHRLNLGRGREGVGWGLWAQKEAGRQMWEMKWELTAVYILCQPTLSLPIEYPPPAFFFYVLIPNEWKAFAKEEEECLLWTAALWEVSWVFPPGQVYTFPMSSLSVEVGAVAGRRRGHIPSQWISVNASSPQRSLETAFIYSRKTTKWQSF